MHGFGQLTWSEGESYLGHFRDNKFEGEGKYQWRDGRIYVGCWRQGKQHGHGKMFINRRVYHGIWVDGVRSGNWIEEYEEPEVDLTLKSDSRSQSTIRG